MSHKLTDKHLAFCNEYLSNGMNGTQAYLSVYKTCKSEETARANASRLLTNANVLEYIASKQEKTAKKLDVSKERVIIELARIAFGNISNLFDEDGQLKPLHELQEDVSAAIGSVETTEESQAVAEETYQTIKVRKVKQWDKLKALDMLSKHLGLYEKDNNQKAATFNMAGLSAPEKLQFLQLLTKASASD